MRRSVSHHTRNSLLFPALLVESLGLEFDSTWTANKLSATLGSSSISSSFPHFLSLLGFAIYWHTLRLSFFLHGFVDTSLSFPFVYVKCSRVGVPYKYWIAYVIYHFRWTCTRATIWSILMGIGLVRGLPTARRKRHVTRKMVLNVIPCLALGLVIESTGVVMARVCEVMTLIMLTYHSLDASRSMVILQSCVLLSVSDTRRTMSFQVLASTTPAGLSLILHSNSSTTCNNGPRR